MAPQPATSHPPYSATHPEQEQNLSPAPDHSGMSAGAIAALVVVLFFFFCAGGYILYTQLRARRLGLPTPSWRTYVPFLPNNRRYNNTRSRAMPALSSYEPQRNEWDHRIDDDDDNGSGVRRGRSRSREPERDGGARGMEADGFVGSGVRGGRMSVDSERRSAFRESIT